HDREPLCAAHMNQSRQERHHQRRIRRVKCKISTKQAHLRAATAPTMADLSCLLSHPLRINARGRDSFETGKSKAGRQGQEHEISSFKYDRRLAIHSQAATPFKHDTKTGLTKIRIANTPCPCST